MARKGITLSDMSHRRHMMDVKLSAGTCQDHPSPVQPLCIEVHQGELCNEEHCRGSPAGERSPRGGWVGGCPHAGAHSWPHLSPGDQRQRLAGRRRVQRQDEDVQRAPEARQRQQAHQSAARAREGAGRVLGVWVGAGERPVRGARVRAVGVRPIGAGARSMRAGARLIMGVGAVRVVRIKVGAEVRERPVQVTAGVGPVVVAVTVHIRVAPAVLRHGGGNVRCVALVHDVRGADGHFTGAIRAHQHHALRDTRGNRTSKQGAPNCRMCFPRKPRVLHLSEPYVIAMQPHQACP